MQGASRADIERTKVTKTCTRVHLDREGEKAKQKVKRMCFFDDLSSRRQRENFTQHFEGPRLREKKKRKKKRTKRFANVYNASPKIDASSTLFARSSIHDRYRATRRAQNPGINGIELYYRAGGKEIVGESFEILGVLPIRRLDTVRVNRRRDT